MTKKSHKFSTYKKILTHLVLSLVLSVYSFGALANAQALTSTEYCAQRGITSADKCKVFLIKAGFLFIGDESTSQTCTTTVTASTSDTTVPSGTFDPTTLTFPAFPDEVAVGASMTQYLKDNFPTTPWLGVSSDVGAWLVKESKARNINPLLIFSIGKQENGFGKNGGAKVTTYFNYFGMKGSGPRVIPGSAYKGFSSAVEGITFFMNVVQTNINGPNKGQYAAVTNFYEYLGKHQSGTIVYPGEDLDPTDRTGPVFDANGNWQINQSSPDNNRQNGYDAAMGVYTSWYPVIHPNKAYNNPDGTANPSNVFNPASYFKNSIALINKLLGLGLSDLPARGAGSASTSCTTSAAGLPLVAGPNGYDLKDTGPNPMIFYSQHTSGTDPAVTGYFGSSAYGKGTVGNCGCGPTSFAMIVSTLTGKSVTPSEMAKWAADNNFQQPGCGSSWWWQDNPILTSQKWGVNVENLNNDFAKAKTALASGKLILMSAGGGNVFVTGTAADDGHIFVMRAFTADGKFLFADPSSDGSKKNRPEFNPSHNVSRTAQPESVIATHLKGMWAISRAAP